MRLSVFSAIATLGFVASCVRAETTLLGKARPPLGENCLVRVEPNIPSFAIETIATSEAMCHQSMGRTACIESLKAEACKVGADIVFGFREGKNQEAHTITASLGKVMANGETSSAQPEQSTDVCTPICSPGFQCVSGTCKPQCNPECGAGFQCGANRTCEAVQ